MSENTEENERQVSEGQRRDKTDQTGDEGEPLKVRGDRTDQTGDEGEPLKVREETEQVRGETRVNFCFCWSWTSRHELLFQQTHRRTCASQLCLRDSLEQWVPLVPTLDP